MALAVCPANSQVMGGGVGDLTDDGVAVINSPDGSDALLAVSDATPTQDNADNFTAFARCWNPLANVGHTNARQAPRALSSSARRLVAQSVRAK